MAVHNCTGTLRRVVVARPEHFRLLPLSETARDAMDRDEAPDQATALRQHQEYVDAFRSAGVDVVFVEPLQPEYAWQVGARDWGLMTPRGPLIGTFRYHERRGEEHQVIQTLERHGYPVHARITRGALEGGDCWYLDEHTVAIGHGERSTEAGVRNAAELLAEQGIDVIPVELYPRWNHLDMVFSVLDEKLAIGCADALPDFFVGFLKGRGFDLRLYPADVVVGQCTLNLLPLGGGRVMSYEGNPINDDLRALGLKVYDPAFTQLTLAGGGPHCMAHELDRDR